MLSMSVPENDEANAKQAIKEQKRKDKAQTEEMDLEACAEVIQKAHEYMADHDLMEKLKPYLDKKMKALHTMKGLQGLKEKAKLAQMREMKKSGQ